MGVYVEGSRYQFGRSSSDIAVLVVGLITSLFIFGVINGHETDIAESDFQTLARNLVEQLEQEIRQSAQETNQLAALIGHNGDLERQVFSDFATGFIAHNPAIMALEWAPRVPNSMRHSFEQMEAKNYPGFQIAQFRSGVGLLKADERPVYFPVRFIEPWVGNDSAHGFDMGSNPDRERMLEQAAEQNGLVMSSAIRILQDAQGRFGFIVAVPVFDVGSERKTGLDNNEALLGFAIGMYQFQGLVEALLASQAHNFGRFDLYQVLDDGYERLVYSHAADNAELGDLDFTSALQFTVGGKHWKTVVQDSADAYSVSRSWLAYVFLALGLLISFLLLERMFFIRRDAHILADSKSKLQAESVRRRALEDELQALREEIDLLSFNDPLMSIPNRRHFESYLETEWKRMVRTGKPLSLIIADIDHFRAYNDRYGHAEGDDCLRTIAATFEQCARRPSDLVARFGGEEFAVLLPETQAVDALNIAQKLRRRVEGLHIETEMSDVSPYVTISLGTYTIDNANGDNANTLIFMAEQALYQAKLGGRDQVISLVFERHAQQLSSATSEIL